MSTLPSWVRAGQKVACISRHVTWDIWDASGYQTPKVGSTYTIRQVVDVDAVRLTELRNTECLVFGTGGPFYGEPCFGYWRFVPLVKTEDEEEVEAEIYRRNVHQKPVPVKELERT